MTRGSGLSLAILRETHTHRERERVREEGESGDDEVLVGSSMGFRSDVRWWDE